MSNEKEIQAPAQAALSAGEVERDRKDAEKWRWLKQQGWHVWQRLGLGLSLSARGTVKSEIGLDAEVDAALSHKEPQR